MTNVGTARRGVGSVKGPGGAGAAPRAPLRELLLHLGQWGRAPPPPLLLQAPAQSMLLKWGGGNKYTSPSLLLPSDLIPVTPVGPVELEAWDSE